MKKMLLSFHTRACAADVRDRNYHLQETPPVLCQEGVQTTSWPIEEVSSVTRFLSLQLSHSPPRETDESSLFLPSQHPQNLA
jgi:hypothetical protein